MGTGPPAEMGMRPTYGTGEGVVLGVCVGVIVPVGVGVGVRVGVQVPSEDADSEIRAERDGRLLSVDEGERCVIVAGAVLDRVPVGLFVTVSLVADGSVLTEALTVEEP
jgi:hypothetical protein